MVLVPIFKEFLNMLGVLHLCSILGFNQVDTLPSSSLYRSYMVEVSVVIPISHPFYVGSLEPNHFFLVQDLL